MPKIMNNNKCKKLTLLRLKKKIKKNTEIFPALKRNKKVDL